jgi:DeoR/GlpR family transcriptional regulator of sugar metabolism
MRSLLGHLTQQAASELRADHLVMGIPAFDIDHGLTSDHLMEIQTDRALHAIARKTIVVADSSKLGRVEPAHVLPLSAIHTLVSDEGLPDDAAAAIEGLGVTVVRA